MGSSAGWTLACAKCGLRWDRVGTITPYEREAVESRPCPGCGGYTLACRDAAHAAARRPNRRPRHANAPRHAA